MKLSMLLGIISTVDSGLGPYMKLKTARKMERRLRRAARHLNACIFDASREMDSKEFERWKSEMGSVLGLVFLRLQQPIYDEYPQLTPKQLLANFKREGGSKQ